MFAYKESWKSERGSMSLAFFLIFATAALSLLTVSILTWQVGQVKNEQTIRETQWALDSAMNLGSEAVGASGRGLIGVPMGEPENWEESLLDGIVSRWWTVPVNAKDIAQVPTPETFAYIASNDNIMIALSFTNLVYLSTDGVSWINTGKTPLPANEISDFTFGNGSFIITARPNSEVSKSLVYYSRNGKTWNAAPIFKPSSLSAETISRVACAPNRCLIITTNPGVSTRYWSSTNMDTWTLVADTTVETNVAAASEVAYGLNRFLAIGFNGVESTVSFSTEGTSWSSASTFASNGLPIKDLEAVGSRFIGVYAGTNDTLLYEDRVDTFGTTDTTQTVISSTDGLVWDNVSLPVSQYWSDLITNGSRAFLLAESNNQSPFTGTAIFLTTSDGINWNTRTLPKSGSYINGAFLRDSAIIASPYTTEVFVASGDPEKAALPLEIYLRGQAKTVDFAEDRALESVYKFTWNNGKSRWELVDAHNELDFSLQAKYSGAPDSGVVRLVNGVATLNFIDASTGSPSSWAWDFGDGTFSTDQNTSKTYTAAGEYTVRLTVSEPGGYSSTFALQIKVQDLASPPRNVVVSPSGESLIVVWDAPLNNGGSNIVNYRVRFRDSPISEWTEQTIRPNLLTHTITGLSERAIYEVQLAAVTSIGVGEWSDSLNQEALQVPTAPRDLALTGLVDMLVTWDAPNNTGGSPISRYRIQTATNPEFTNNVIITDLVASPSKIIHLGEFTTYYARIFAINSVGISAPSNTVTVTTIGRPTVPNTYLVDAVDDKIEVSWTAPTSDGGSPITGHIVEYTLIENDFDAGIRIPLASSATSYEIDATPGVTYFVRVKAVSAAGSGVYTTVQSATGNLAPQTLPGLTASGEQESVLISWSPQTTASNGGATITNYTISWLSSNNVTNSVTVSGSTNSILIDGEDTTGDGISDGGLTPGRNYIFTITATNAVGSSNFTVSGVPTS